MDDKHDPNGTVPTGTFKATSEDGDVEIPIEIVVDENIEPNQLAIEAQEDSEPLTTSRGAEELPRRQRVATLLGVPLPGSAAARAAAESGDPRKATSHEIDIAIEDALEERPTTVYGYKRESLAELASIVEREMTEIPSSETTGEIVGVVARSSDTGTYEIEVRDSSEPKTVPVLAPSQFVEARARDQREPSPQAQTRDLVSGDRALREAPRADAPRIDLSRQDAPRVAAAATMRTMNGVGPDAPRARTERIESDVVQKPISSLAPVELKRQAPKQKEPASGVGYALVAAMVLLGIGGWFLTSGGYRRASDEAAQPMAAARPTTPSDSLGAAKLPAPTAAPEAPEAAPPTEAAAPTPAPATEHAASWGGTSPSRPRVASKSVRRSGAPQPGDQAIDTPSRTDVLNGLDRVRSNVQACAEGRNGVAEVDLTIAANGIVTNALVGGDFGGTPQGSCIARAVRKARFPTFKQDRYRVLFPYVL